jgi:hypothetical protein
MSRFLALEYAGSGGVPYNQGHSIPHNKSFSFPTGPHCFFLAKAHEEFQRQ